MTFSFSVCSAIAACTWVIVASTPAFAQGTAPLPSLSAPADDKLARAKESFRKGLALLDAEDFERALAHFVESRRLVASSKNTANAAICLGKLGRYDEALEMYEELLTEFNADLEDEDRTVIGPAMAALRKQVGGVQISSNVEGTVIIDGRPRGKLPTLTPIRVLDGRHVVRILKDGFAPFEKSIEVQVGATLEVQASLLPLANAGLLRVEDPILDGADVFVDGVQVGTAPWEGTLGPGRHLVWTRKEAMGSAPSSIVVLQGQTALARVSSGALGPPIRIQVEPAAGVLTLDGVEIGRGVWEGRLPTGRHVVAVAEEGYHPSSTPFDVPANGSDALTVDVRLEVDPDDPWWGGDLYPGGKITLELFGGPAFSPSLGSGAEASCDRGATCPSNLLAIGFLEGARVGYEFPIPIAIEVAGGFMYISRTVERSVPESFVTGATRVATRYDLVDTLRISGPFAGGAVSYRQPFVADTLELRGRVTVGAVLVSSSHDSTGTAFAGDTGVGVAPVHSGRSSQSADLLVMPEVQLGFRRENFSIGLGLGVAVLALDGPENEIDALQTRAACDPSAPTNIRCAPQEGFIDGEHTYGAFVMVLPIVSVGYAF